ncbi:hypothetical protein M422DRAFT_34560, partial [Sphaerobolus stellatus SS14]
MSTIWKNRFNEVDNDATILGLRFVGSTGLEQDSDKPFHWRIYFVISPSKSSDSGAIMFDLTPGGDGSTGILCIVSKTETNSSALDLESYYIEASGASITVKELINYAIANKFDKYSYHSSGNGCRWWSIILGYHLEKVLRIIPQGSMAEFEAFLAQQSALKPNKIPMPTIQGVFYDGTVTNL